MVKRRTKRRLLVDRFKKALRTPAVLRTALLFLRLVDTVARLLDRSN
jgi:hypothetical protein